MGSNIVEEPHNVVWHSKLLLILGYIQCVSKNVHIFLNNMMKNLPNLVIFGTQNPDIICSLANSNFAALPKNCRCTTL